MNLISSPYSPDEVNLKEFYPTIKENEKIEIVDVGCAYGGFLTSIATLLPTTYMLGMEIRLRVAEYTQNRIKKLREENPGKYNNIWAIRANAMKHITNYFHKGQLSKIFFMYPDPHFKKKNHRRRIITTQLLAYYAYILKEGGMIYTITDVKELGDWMNKHLSEHPLFERVSDEELKKDPLIPYVRNASEDGQRTDQQKKSKHMHVFRKKKFIP